MDAPSSSSPLNPQTHPPPLQNENEGKDNQSIAIFCKAQSDLNGIRKEYEHTYKSLGERISTYRSLLSDRMEASNLSCIEVATEEEEDPVYVRKKPVCEKPSITTDLILSSLRQTDADTLMSVAEENENDIPRILSCLFRKAMRESRTVVRTTLSVSKSREKGFDPKLGHEVAGETYQMATDLLQAKKELRRLKEQEGERKKESQQRQKTVEEEVKDALKRRDEAGSLTKVQLRQKDGEWTYYLRRKEKETTPVLGVKTVCPMIETQAAGILDSLGMERTLRSAQLPDLFWDDLEKAVEKALSTFSSSGGKVTQSIRLERGAPRRGGKRKVDTRETESGAEDARQRPLPAQPEKTIPWGKET